jgi:hypothetical protein
MQRGQQRLRGPASLVSAIATAVLALAIVGLQPALARPAYVHGGIDDCETCHVNAHTWWTPTNEHCLGCHGGFQVRATDLLCWTCHAPGQDMSAAREDAACTQACHLPDGSESVHQEHAGVSLACGTCHAVSSVGDPAGSPHHTVPAPGIAGLSPRSGLPGTTVTITGSHLGGANAVSFSGIWAVFAAVDDDLVTAVVPVAASSGPVTVVTRGGSAVCAEPFIVTARASLTATVRPARLRLRRRVKVSGTLTPVMETRSSVKVAVQRRRGGGWRTVATAVRTASTAGGFSWTYRPSRRGVYRVAASVAAAPEHTAARSRWRVFRVR